MVVGLVAGAAAGVSALGNTIWSNHSGASAICDRPGESVPVVFRPACQLAARRDDVTALASHIEAVAHLAAVSNPGDVLEKVVRATTSCLAARRVWQGAVFGLELSQRRVAILAVLVVNVEHPQP